MIEQYEGHKAEACISVYDGDIVTLYDNQFCEDLGVGVVKSSCYLMVDKDGKYMEADMSRDLNNVLGNIHENPERLEEK